MKDQLEKMNNRFGIYDKSFTLINPKELKDHIENHGKIIYEKTSVHLK